jgi:plastocyanin
MRRAATVTGLVAAAVLAGCGSGSSGGGTPAAASPAASGSASGAPASAGTAQQVTVTATEYHLALPSTNLAPGTYTFTMDDAGHATHSIEINGPGVQNQKSATARPGGTARLTVTLQPGTYDLWCPVGNHRALGMETKLTVG